MNPQDGELLATFEISFKGIALLEQAQLIQPCLVLLFSTIDAAAALDVPGDGDVTRAAFVSWVERYVLPGSGLRCTALELYAARCGLLHSLTAFSKLSREGKARTISYAWGAASVDDLHITVRVLGRVDIVGVHVTKLQEALRVGFQSFLLDIASDASRLAAVRKRAAKLFSHLPIFPVASIARHASESASD